MVETFRTSITEIGQEGSDLSLEKIIEEWEGTKEEAMEEEPRRKEEECFYQFAPHVPVT